MAPHAPMLFNDAVLGKVIDNQATPKAAADLNRARQKADPGEKKKDEDVIDAEFEVKE